MLRVTLLGNLGADPEVRYTTNGAQIVSFRVAVNLVRKGPDGERQENTEWFRIRVSGRQSEFVQRLSKGARVLAIGRLDITHYVGKDGEPRIGYDVWADDVQAFSRAPFDGDDRAPDGAVEREPALAAVSSLGGANSSMRGASTNGRTGARAARQPSADEAAQSEDLEDLPF